MNTSKACNNTTDITLSNNDIFLSIQPKWLKQLAKAGEMFALLNSDIFRCIKRMYKNQVSQFPYYVQNHRFAPKWPLSHKQ